MHITYIMTCSWAQSPFSS